MSHYFTKENNTLKSNPKVIAFRVNNEELKFNTDHGVFAKDNFDRGTEVLLRFLEVNETAKTALDLGCGYGVVGIYLNKAYGLAVDMVDVNLRAVALSRSNVLLNNAEANVYESDAFSNIKRTFDLIVLNPPIRAGKEIYYKMFEESAKFLNVDGSFWVVINKKHGAASAIKKLNTIYGSVTEIDKKKGFYVVVCKNRLTI